MSIPITDISTTVTDGRRWLDLTGLFANALLGGVIARSAKLDPVGFAVLAILSGLGGGLIRDVLLLRDTPIALTDYAYVLTALVGAGVAFLLPIAGPVWDKVWRVVDALALGCWVAAGAQKTLAYGLGWLPAVLLGTITAFGGGFVRDVIMERIPGIVGGNTLYATCALAASAVMVVMYRSGLPAAGSVVATLVGAGLCLLARWRHWVLPQNDSWNAAHALRVRYVRSAQCLGGRDNRRSGQHDA